MAKESNQKVLSVRQPWAWLLVNGHKDVENRTWSTGYRGPCLIHAGKTFDQAGYDWVRRHFKQIRMPEPSEFKRGGIVGRVTITDCVTRLNSKWFSGPYGFVMDAAEELPFVPIPGKLNFFEIPDPILIQVEVTPPSMITSSRRKAKVKVTIKNVSGKPMAGVALKARTQPSTLGKISSLPKTNKRGESRGSWQAGNQGGRGALIVTSSIAQGEAEIELRTPVISVIVTPPVLIANSGSVAGVVTEVEDTNGDPMQGLALRGETTSLGRVTGLPNTDSDGMSAGFWHAGRSPGKGFLIVTVKDGGQQGAAPIVLLPRPPEPDDDGEGDGEDDNGDKDNGDEGGEEGGGDNDGGDGNENGGDEGGDRGGNEGGEDTGNKDGDDGGGDDGGDNGGNNGNGNGGNGGSGGTNGGRNPHAGRGRRKPQPPGSSGSKGGRSTPGSKDSGSGG